MWGMGMKTKGMLVFLAALIVLTGCYEHRYIIGTGAPNGRLVYDHWHNHWLGGLISPNQEMELMEICPSGNATIHEEATFLNGLVGSLTAGIYEPTTVKVWCAENGRRMDLELTSEEVERIVSDPEFIVWVRDVAPELVEEVEGARGPEPR